MLLAYYKFSSPYISSGPIITHYDGTFPNTVSFVINGGWAAALVYDQYDCIGMLYDKKKCRSKVLKY